MRTAAIVWCIVICLKLKPPRGKVFGGDPNEKYPFGAIEKGNPRISLQCIITHSQAADGIIKMIDEHKLINVYSVINIIAGVLNCVLQKDERKHKMYITK